MQNKTFMGIRHTLPWEPKRILSSKRTPSAADIYLILYFIQTFEIESLVGVNCYHILRAFAMLNYLGTYPTKNKLKNKQVKWYFHLLMKKCFAYLGDVVYQYLTPYTFRRTRPNNDLIDFSTTEKSNIAYFVYEQANGRIDVPIETDLCGPQLNDRFQLNIWIKEVDNLPLSKR